MQMSGKLFILLMLHQCVEIDISKLVLKNREHFFDKRNRLKIYEFSKFLKRKGSYLKKIVIIMYKFQRITGICDEKHPKAWNH
jgi:hypothetical protein